MNKKVIKLTEKDIESLVRKIVTESNNGEVQNYMFFQNLKEIRDNINNLLSMDQQEVDRILSDGHGWALEHMATAKDDIEEVTSFLTHRDGGINEGKTNKPCWKDYEMIGMKMKGGKEVPNCVPIDEEEVYELGLNEGSSDCDNRKLNTPWLTPDGLKKRSVCVKNDKGNVVKVNFGDPNMRIKKSNPERRKSFRARHNCENPGPKWKARYWSCKAW